MHYLRRNRRVSHYRSTNILTAIPGVDRKYSSRLLRREFRLQLGSIHFTWNPAKFLRPNLYLEKSCIKNFSRIFLPRQYSAYSTEKGHLDAPTRSMDPCRLVATTFGRWRMRVLLHTQISLEFQPLVHSKPEGVRFGTVPELPFATYIAWARTSSILSTN